MAKSRKEKEVLFMRAFEDQTLFIRNKELRCANSPVENLLTPESAQSMIVTRQAFFDGLKRDEQRKAITRKETEASRAPANRIETTQTPTFNPLLNVHFESQFAILQKFKNVISEIITRNRAQKRTRMLAQHLINVTTNAVKSFQDRLDEKSLLTAHSLLSLKIGFKRPMPQFATPYQLSLPAPPEGVIEGHRVEKPFKLYTPDIVERFQLTPFPRAEITTYIATPITPPETFPVVPEEQPVRERIVPPLDLEDAAVKDQKTAPTSLPAPAKRIVQHPREIRYYSFDPSYCLRPQPTQLPDVPDEIGKSSILALPLSEYEKMTISGKTKAPFAPFEFVGVPTFAECGLPVMTAADPIDLKELEADDDIDGIDIQPKVRPITDFITRPLNTKNKSYVIAEAISEGQAQWRDRQRKGVNGLIEKMNSLNQLMRDKSLALPMNDLIDYMKQ